MKKNRMALVSIVIPVHNALSYTKQCVEYLYENTDPLLSFEVIVVDDGSTDETPRWLSYISKRYPSLSYIRRENNGGFSKACNLGVNHARGKYILFLNNDTIPLKGWLSAMLRALENERKVGIVGSKLLYPDRTIQHAGILFANAPFPIHPYHIHRGKPHSLPEANIQAFFPCVTGACILMPKILFLEAGGFDESYINGCEDVDLCLTIREKGYKILYCPSSVLYHFESKSPGRNKIESLVVNVKRIHEKWLGRVTIDTFYGCPKVSIVLVNYNSTSHTIECLDSLRSLLYRQRNIIVVDNNSKIDPAAEIRLFCRKHGIRFVESPHGQSKDRFKGDIYLVRNKENLGFGGGCNVGVRLAIELGACYVWVLNNNTLVDSMALDYLVSLAIASPKVAIIGSRLNSYPNTNEVYFDGNVINYPPRKPSSRDLFDWIREVTFIPSASMLISSVFLTRHGLFDEKYFLYFEDNEICLKAIKNGYQIFYHPFSVVYHKGASTVSPFISPDTSIYYMVRNMLFFHAKHYGLQKAKEQLEYICTQWVPRIAASHPEYLEVIRLAVGHFLEGRYGRVELPQFGGERVCNPKQRLGI